MPGCRRNAFVVVICALLGLLAIGPAASAKAKRQFSQAKTLATYVRQHQLAGGCKQFGYVVPPGKAVHPSDEGVSAAELGIGRDAYEMNNRIIEWAGCSVTGSRTTLGLSRFDGHGLPLPKYRHWLESSILPEACQLAKPDDTIVEAIWSSGGSLWNAEPSSIEYEGVAPLPVGRRKALLSEITDLVGGDIVASPC